MRPVAFSSLLLLSASLSSACLYKRADDDWSATSWSYGGKTGPSLWHSLENGKYLTCATGKHQSPINLDMRNEDGIEKLLPGKVVLNYGDKGDFKVTNVGHTIQGEPKHADGKVKRDGHEKYSLEYNNQKYSLVNFHFHTPAEHRIDDRAYPLEVHFVHENSTGGLAVVGMLFDLAYGEEHNERFLGNLVPADHKDHQPEGIWSLNRKDSTFDAKDLTLSKMVADVAASHVYHYEGSLTVPPCTEGVQWFVLETIKKLSIMEYTAFRKNLRFNQRYTQNSPTEPNLAAAQCAWEKEHKSEL